MIDARLPIVKQWQSSFTELKADGRPVTVQGAAWVIRNAFIHDVQDHIVVLDTMEHYELDSRGAMGMCPPHRHFVSYDAIAGIAFEIINKAEGPTEDLHDDEEQRTITVP